MPSCPAPLPMAAVAIPLRDEAERIGDCVAALDRAAAGWNGRVRVVAFANGCRDNSVAVLDALDPKHLELVRLAATLLPPHAHAGWARRIALDAAADLLAAPGDLLLSTDADTLVAPDWFAANARRLAGGRGEGGWDAVAGRAVTTRAERAAHGVRAKRRLDDLGRYYTLLDRLRAATRPEEEPWPRHYYEGGASIALTLGLYRRIGGAPTPPLAEDRALFNRIRAAGGRVCHPVDVRAFTSARADGRAPGGMADTVAGWIAQDEDAPLHETYALPVALSPEGAVADDQLSFRTLPAAIRQAQALVRSLGPLPEVEPVFVPPLGDDVDERVLQPAPELAHRLIAGLGIVGVAGPVDEKDVAA